MRRVEIARALLHRPRMLLLDEPTVGLDVKARADILKHVRGLVTQRKASACSGRRILSMRSGPGDDVVLLHEGKSARLRRCRRGRCPRGRAGHCRRLQETDRRRRGGGNIMGSGRNREAARRGLWPGPICALLQRHRLARGFAVIGTSGSGSSRLWCARWFGCSSSPRGFARSSACRSSRPTIPMYCMTTISRRGSWR